MMQNGGKARGERHPVDDVFTAASLWRLIYFRIRSSVFFFFWYVNSPVAALQLLQFERRHKRTKQNNVHGRKKTQYKSEENILFHRRRVALCLI